MYQRPYVTATWLSLLSVVGIAGQMVVEGTANIAFLAVSAVPVVLAVARLRRR